MLPWASPPARDGRAAASSSASSSSSGRAIAPTSTTTYYAPPPGSLTASASCPTFSYEMPPDELLDPLQDDRAVHGGQSAGNLMAAMAHHAAPDPFAADAFLQPAGLHLGGGDEPLGDGVGSSAFLPDKGYDFLLQFQQEHLSPTQRQFPHQQALDGETFAGLLAAPASHKRGFHGSASFTNLSSMEAELARRQNAAKRKKGGSERWHKLQRHKSFDSTTMPDLDFVPPSYSAPPGSNYFGPGSALAMAPLPATADTTAAFPSGSAYGDLLDEFPPNFSTEPDWPTSMPMVIDSFDGNNADDAPDSAVFEELGLPSSSAMTTASLETPAKAMGAAVSSIMDEGKNLPVDANTSAELDLLLSDKERENMSSLFDAIRDFSSPSDSTISLSSAPPSSGSSPVMTSHPSPSEGRGTPVMRRKESRAGCVTKRKTTHSPPLHPNSRGRDDSNHGKPFSLNSTSPPSGLPPQRPLEPPSVPMRMRLQQILIHSVQNSDAGAMLSVMEMEFLKLSPLFSPSKAAETAGSLWLLLHSAQCDSACEIAGCDVMRRVLNHCMGCELPVGKCKQPCNDAKAMLLHYGSCNSKGSMHGKSCTVCWNLLEIDHAHQAAADKDGKPPVSGSPHLGSSPTLLPMPMNRSPGATSFVSPTLRPSTGSGGGSSSAPKHVPIQPNPLPTASNPMGLIGSFPHFGYSLSLYLEQTSAPFRAEVKARVEKRVTAAASQDLVQHMQKKTRLRSLDDLRSEARTIVLGEMERELHFHMQAYSWATTNGKAMGDPSATYPGGTPGALGGNNALPPYLLSVAAAGFAALYAQQATLQAATLSAGHSLPLSGGGRSSSGSTGAASSAPAGSRRRASGGRSVRKESFEDPAGGDSEKPLAA